MDNSFSTDNIIIRIPGVVADKIDLSTGKISSLESPSSFSTEGKKSSTNNHTPQAATVLDYITPKKTKKSKKKSKKGNNNSAKEEKDASESIFPEKNVSSALEAENSKELFLHRNSNGSNSKPINKNEPKTFIVDSVPFVINVNKEPSNKPAPRKQVRKIQRGIVSKAVYVPCPPECIPVSQGINDDIILPVVFPLLFYNTGRSFDSYDRDFLPWSDHKQIRICVPKYVLVDED